ncbi:MAG: LD-carboxypeptidase [Bacteroidales bacterium]|nr:LD-carboxypeptidase [Bacteroidales bacterium]
MRRPPLLTKGDKIGIAAPARKIQRIELEASLKIVEDRGYEVVLNDSLFAAENQFAGSDRERANYLQGMLDDESVKAIFFARGGYGSVRIIDRLDFTKFEKNPKWLVGYSDATVFLCHINRNCGVQTLHASMPVNFLENTPAALDSLFSVLADKPPKYVIEPHPLNKSGQAKGVLTGGNLSVLYSLLGSISFPETEGKILFLEDLDEYLYHIDRMMQGLKRAGKLDRLAALVVGGMTELNDNTIPFGKTAEEIILETVKEFDYPVFFGFPAGHLADNRALTMGGELSIESGDKIQFTFK